MNSLEKLISQLSELTEVKKFKYLDGIISSSSYNSVLSEMFEIQQLMVNAKHYQLDDDFYEYQKQYNDIKSKLDDDLIVNEYLNRLDDVNLILKTITKIITSTLDDELNKVK